MSWVGWCIIASLFCSVIFLGLMILRAQKELDAPCKGQLIVDRNDIDGNGTLVYIQSTVSPETLTNGERVKLVVKVVEKKSQLKQARV